MWLHSCELKVLPARSGHPRSHGDAKRPKTNTYLLDPQNNDLALKIHSFILLTVTTLSPEPLHNSLPAPTLSHARDHHHHGHVRAHHHGHHVCDRHHVPPPPRRRRRTTTTTRRPMSTSRTSQGTPPCLIRLVLQMGGLGCQRLSSLMGGSDDLNIHAL